MIANVKDIDLSKAPENFLKLIRIHGNVNKASKAMGVDAASGYKIARGERTLTDTMSARIDEALKAAGSTTIPSASKAPTFKVASGSKKQKKLKKCPPLLQQLIDKFEGNRTAASRAMGYRSTAWLTGVGNGKKPFNEAAQKRVESALKGETVVPPPAKRLDIIPHNAILIVKGDPEFEQLYDIGQTMGGAWLWKKKAGVFWIGVIRMGGSNLTAYLALATAKGVESYAT